MSLLSESRKLLNEASGDKKPTQRFPFPLEGESKLPSQLQVNSFLLNFPFSIHTDEANNAWMRDLPPAKRKIDRQKAFIQFLDLYTYLAASALVYVLPSQQGLQDQTYVANLGLVVQDEKKDQFILAKFQSPPRRGEEEPGRKFMELMGYNVKQPPVYWEGEADLKYVRENIYFGGYGQRTDKKAYDWMMDEYDMKITPIKMKDEYLYHFDCCFFPIDDESAAVCTSLLDPADIKAIEKVCEILPVSKDDAYMGITNSCRMGELYMNADLLEGFEQGTEEYDMEVHKQKTIEDICKKRQLEPVLFDLFEFTKSGALLSCLIMHFNYPDYNKGYV